MTDVTTFECVRCGATVQAMDTGFKDLPPGTCAEAPPGESDHAWAEA